MGYILPYSGIDLQSKEGLSLLIEFAERNQLLSSNVTLEECISQLISVEEEMYADAMSAYWDTLLSARPNCWE